MFIPVSVSCLIVVCRLVDRHNNFYFQLFLAAWNQLITLIILNFNIYDKNTCNIQYRPSLARNYEQCNAHAM